MMEFGAKLSLKDNMYATLQKNLKIQKQFSEQIKGTDKSIQELGKRSANPVIRLKDNVTGSLNGIRQQLRAMSDVKTMTRVEVDNEATRKVEEINRKIKELGKVVASPFIRIKETVTSKADNIKQKLKQIAITYTPIVKIRDLASQGLAKIKNTLNWMKVATVTPLIMLKDKATAGVNKIRVALKTAGKIVSKPFVTLKDKASPVLDKMKGALKTVGKTVAKPFVALKDGASKMLTSIKNGLKSVGSTVAKATVAIKDGATAGLSKIKSILGTLAKGVTIAVGIAGAGATALLGGSISQGASLEQSMGGVETLFKGDASTVKANADMAFKTAGLSANAYMETVTGFSASLLNSLGGDTAKSAKIADMAIIDMADNANKFGTDMDAIQNAYQGFAKQNYTMLDNLKLGYGGTQEEMSRLLADATKLTGVQYNIDNLSDVYSAVHAIQENLGVTGTTAKEASLTFSGSFASMKASAQNLLGNLAVGGDVTSSMEQLVDSASTFLFDNAIPMIGRIFEGLPDAISVAVEKGAPKLKELGGKIVSSIKSGLKSALPSELGALIDPAFDGIGTAIRGSIGAVKSLLQGLLPVVTNVITTMAPVIGKIGDMFNRVAPVVEDALSGAFKNGGGFIEGFADIVSGAIPVVEQVITSLAQIFGAVLPAIQPIITTLGSLIQTIFPVIQNIISVFGNIVSTVFPIIASVIGTALNAVMPVVNALANVIQIALPIVQNVISVVAGVIQAVMPTISRIFTEVGAKVAEVINTVVVPVMGVLQGIFETVSPIIQSAVEILAQVFSATWDIVSPIIDLAMTLFNALWSVVEAVFPAIQSTIETVWSVLEPVFGAIANGLSLVGDAISGVSDFVGNGISTIGSWFGFAYGKDRVPYDNYPAVLHQGEKVLTRNQADQYERSMSTRGVKLSAEVKPVSGGTADTRETVTAQESTKVSTTDRAIEVKVEFNNAVIQKDANVDEFVGAMVKKFNKLIPILA